MLISRTSVTILLALLVLSVVVTIIRPDFPTMVLSLPTPTDTTYRTTSSTDNDDIEDNTSDGYHHPSTIVHMTVLDEVALAHVAMSSASFAYHGFHTVNVWCSRELVALCRLAIQDDVFSSSTSSSSKAPHRAAAGATIRIHTIDTLVTPAIVQQYTGYTASSATDNITEANVMDLLPLVILAHAKDSRDDVAEGELARGIGWDDGGGGGWFVSADVACIRPVAMFQSLAMESSVVMAEGSTPRFISPDAFYLANRSLAVVLLRAALPHLINLHPFYVSGRRGPSVAMSQGTQSLGWWPKYLFSRHVLHSPAEEWQYAYSMAVRFSNGTSCWTTLTSLILNGSTLSASSIIENHEKVRQRALSSPHYNNVDVQQPPANTQEQRIHETRTTAGVAATVVANATDVHFLWIGPKLSNKAYCCIASYAYNGFRAFVWTYTLDLKVPPGVSTRNLAEHFPPDYHMRITHFVFNGSAVALSDIARYTVLELYGGWWMDTDMFCLKPAARYASLIETRPAVFGFQSADIINGAVLHLTNRSLAGHLKQRALSLLVEKNFTIGWYDIGPDLLTRVFHEQQLDVFGVPPSVFYPISPEHIVRNLFWTSMARNPGKHLRLSLGIHLYNAVTGGERAQYESYFSRLCRKIQGESIDGVGSNKKRRK